MLFREHCIILVAPRRPVRDAQLVMGTQAAARERVSVAPKAGAAAMSSIGSAFWCGLVGPLPKSSRISRARNRRLRRTAHRHHSARCDAMRPYFRLAFLGQTTPCVVKRLDRKSAVIIDRILGATAKREALGVFLAPRADALSSAQEWCGELPHARIGAGP